MPVSMRTSRALCSGESHFLPHEKGLMKSWAPQGWPGLVLSVELRDVDSDDESGLLESRFALLSQLGTFIQESLLWQAE